MLYQEKSSGNPASATDEKLIITEISTEKVFWKKLSDPIATVLSQQR
jgi:hypothetical protein